MGSCDILRYIDYLRLHGFANEVDLLDSTMTTADEISLLFLLTSNGSLSTDMTRP